MAHPSRQRGPGYRSLPLWRDAQRLLLDVERVVRGFPRYHKYTLGSELRRQAMDISRLVARAAQQHEPQARLPWLEQLVWKVEDLKMSLQLGSQLQVFASFAQFQRLAEQAVVLGKQSGGWRRKAGSAVQATAHEGRDAGT